MLLALTIFLICLYTKTDIAIYIDLVADGYQKYIYSLRLLLPVANFAHFYKKKDNTCNLFNSQSYSQTQYL